MDFSIIFQLRDKKFWWIDLIFWSMVCLLVATIFCYLIFVAKVYYQNAEIASINEKMKEVGTDQQKENEKEVLSYQKKINDFVQLFNSHSFASNVFAFMEKETLPNVWFKNFSLDPKSGSVGLSGEADNMETFSRQIASFEKNKYIKDLGLLNSSGADALKVSFNLNITLMPEIFDYISTSAPNTPGQENGQTPISNEPPPIIAPPIINLPVQE